MPIKFKASVFAFPLIDQPPITFVETSCQLAFPIASLINIFPLACVPSLIFIEPLTSKVEVGKLLFTPSLPAFMVNVFFSSIVKTLNAKSLELPRLHNPAA